MSNPVKFQALARLPHDDSPLGKRERFEGFGFHDPARKTSTKGTSKNRHEHVRVQGAAQ